MTRVAEGFSVINQTSKERHCGINTYVGWELFDVSFFFKSIYVFVGLVQDKLLGKFWFEYQFGFVIRKRILNQPIDVSIPEHCMRSLLQNTSVSTAFVSATDMIRLLPLQLGNPLGDDRSFGSTIRMFLLQILTHSETASISDIPLIARWETYILKTYLPNRIIKIILLSCTSRSVHIYIILLWF